jgi:Ca-activated chloride channel homolog
MTVRAVCLVVFMFAFVDGVLTQQPVFRTDAQVVSLYATATDGSRRPVSDLLKEDFAIFDNNEPQRTVIFASDVQPISIVVMLDTSASMTGNLKLLEQAAEQFVLRLLPADKAMVGAFNDKIEFVPKHFTSDRDTLVASLRELDFGNPTKLYDAIAASIGRLREVSGRRVVLVFTDGADTSSEENVRSVLAMAHDYDVMIYAVGLRSDYFNGARRVRSKPDGGLKGLAAETGGGYFELDDSVDLAPTFTKIAHELHTQYVLGFAPPVLDGKLHRVEVRVNRPGVTVRTRRSYVAAADSN